MACGFFWFIKSAEYQTANPGQDFDDLEAHAFDPEVDATRPVVSATHVRSESGDGMEPADQQRLFSPVRGRGEASTERPRNGMTAHDKSTVSREA